MRRKSYFNIIGILVASMLLFAACEEQNELVKLDPKLVTWQLSNITSNSAKASGYVIAEGDGFTERGICWNTTAAPTTTDKKAVVEKVESAVFTATMTGLNYATKYYVRAYAIKSDGGTLYGADTSFTTLPVLPTVTTTDATEVTGITAISGGKITNNGGAEITAKGVCWSINPNPTIADSKTKDGIGSAEFTSNVIGLNGLTTYFLRAYATNSVGTTYGNEVTFTTLIADIKWEVPGEHQGWDPASAPTIENTKSMPNTITGYVWLTGKFKFTTGGNWNKNWGVGATPGTLALNGSDLAVETPGYYRITVDFAKMTYEIFRTDWGLIGSSTADQWNSDQNLTYSESSKTLMITTALTVGKIKFRANDNWNLNLGGSNGELFKDGADIDVPVAGNYTVTLDLSKPNVAAYTVNTWGLIGDATPGKWDSDTNMEIVDGKWVLTLNLTAGNIKFRANDAWTINLGDTGADGSLEAGGADIAVTAGNYTITLDLVTNTYTLVKN